MAGDEDSLPSRTTLAGSPHPSDTKRVLSALIEVAGDPDPVKAVLSDMIRQSLLRAWGEFQEEHPLIVEGAVGDR
jgi:hypothetical protein